MCLLTQQNSVAGTLFIRWFTQEHRLPVRSFVFIGIFLAFAPLARAGELSVTIAGAIPNGTDIYVALCSGGLDPAFCLRGSRKTAAAATEQFDFDHLPAGRYAVLAFQDLNRSGTLERSGLGIPLEPFAFSNDAGAHKKPTFEAASFAIGDIKVEIPLKLHSLVRSVAPQ